jgi:hypothetical protein
MMQGQLLLNILLIFSQEVTISHFCLLVPCEAVGQLRLVESFFSLSSVFGCLVVTHHHTELTSRCVTISKMVQIYVILVCNTSRLSIL